MVDFTRKKMFIRLFIIIIIIIIIIIYFLSKLFSFSNQS